MPVRAQGGKQKQRSHLLRDRLFSFDQVVGGLTLDLSLRETDRATAFFPLTALAESFDTLKALHDGLLTTSGS